MQALQDLNLLVSPLSVSPCSCFLPRHLPRPLLPARRAALAAPMIARGSRSCNNFRARRGIPLVAAGDVHYHVPARMVLHDVLTAIRHGTTVAAAEGTLLFPNAERHLRPLDEIRALFAAAPDAIARTVEIADRCRFSLDELRYEYPTELAPAGPDAARVSHAAHLARRGRALSGRRAGKSPPAARVRTRAHRRPALRIVFSHRVGPRALRPLAKHSVPGPRLGGQLGRVLLPGRHVGRPGHERPVVRAVRQPRAERSAGHRRRLRARAARGSAAIRVRKIRPRAGRPGGHGDHLLQPLGDPRRRQGARPVARSGRRAGQARRRLHARAEARRPLPRSGRRSGDPTSAGGSFTA